MSNVVKTYILAPTLSTPPEGPVLLGNVIALPDHPEEAENTKPPARLEGPNQMWHAWKRGNKITDGQSSEVSVGFFATFLQMTGVGGDIDIGKRDDDEGGLTVEKIDTYWFNPNKAYFEQAVADPGVSAYLQTNRSWFSHAYLYMITGIMVARGAKATKQKLTERHLHTQFGVDLTSLGVPISVGPKVDLAKSKEDTASFNESSDFILAYRVKKFRLRKNGTTKTTDYNKGALYADDPAAPEDRTEAVDELLGADVDIEEADLSTEDVTGYELKDFRDVDDQEAWVCARIKS